MRIIFVFITIFITYESLYPFDFSCQKSFSESLLKLNNTWITPISRDDSLANIALFLPFGYAGILSINNKYKAFSIFIILIGAGTIFACLLQVFQLCLIRHDPYLFDGVLNGMGISIGATIGWLQLKYQDDEESIFNHFLTTKTFLIVSWLFYKLLPLVPSLYFNEIENSVKPLFLSNQFTWINILHDAVAWIVVWYLWSNVTSRYTAVKHFILCISITFFLEIIIIDNVLTLSNVYGAVLAVIVWPVANSSKHIEKIIISSLVFSILCGGTYPFDFNVTDSSFHWLPFYGLLQGNMELSTSVVFDKFFFYGCLLYFLNKYIKNWNVTIISISSFAVLIEFLQLYSFGRLSEITEPLLVVVFGIFLKSTKDTSKELKKFIEDIKIVNNKYEVIMVPKSAYLQEQLPVEGVIINHFPFQIGRHQHKNAVCTILENEVIFVDREPYHLSRKHLTIDIDKDNVLVVHDTSSLGTTINGIKIGGKAFIGVNLDKGILRIGKNELVLGGVNSDFKFYIIINIIYSR